MKRLLWGIVMTVMSTGVFAADNGLITKPSKYSVSETLNRVETAAKAKGMMIFARIDHSGEAEKAGLALAKARLLQREEPQS